jgi:tetratricopeptide (TPR) repeat protein
MSFYRALVMFALAGLSFAAEDYSAKIKDLLKEKKFDEAAKVLETADTKAKAGAPNQPLADAHVLLGNAYMYEDSLPPFRKYPSALRQFRKALEYDKENKKAKANIATIEGIYKSMGRPVPQ